MDGLDWRRLPSLSALRAFEATARLGGFAAAARALNVTHPAVAQQVRGLEAELGVALVRREGRGLGLTAEGSRLAARLGEGFATVAAAVEAARSAEQRRGVRMTATPALTQSLLLPRLGRFWAQHPSITVSVTPTYEVIDLAAAGYDLGIRSGRAGQTWPGLESEEVAEAQYILVGAPSLVGSGRAVADLPWIGPFDRHEAQMLRESGRDPERMTVNVIDDAVLSVLAAVQGLGLLFVTDVIVRDDLEAGRLVQVPFGALPRFSYHIVAPPGPRRPAVQAFVAWLRTVFREAMRAPS